MIIRELLVRRHCGCEFYRKEIDGELMDMRAVTCKDCTTELAIRLERLSGAIEDQLDIFAPPP